MTTVTFRYTNGQITEMTAKGHTGYAEIGSDIVCASISTVTQTVALGLTQVAKVPCSVKTRDGFLTVKLASNLTAAQREAADLLLLTAKQALTEISKAYCAYIKVEEI